MSESVTVNGAGAATFGGTVETVLQTPRTQVPPATLEEARNQPGRRERIEEIARRIQNEGIKYVFFQQVSVTGRVMGKGVVADFFPQVAERGYQLVYGATANLFVDRLATTSGSTRTSRSSPRWLTSTPSPCSPGTRAWRACTATATTPSRATCSTQTAAQNLKHVVKEFEDELGMSFLIGIEPEMMWLKSPEDGQEPEGVTKPYCYHIHQFEELRPVLHGRGRVRPGARPRHVLR